ncbi:MAG TPA: hypothetical protein VG738_22095 [Chitinophagaceae bacterium]|nr:hypothetical protein [Chitinophagaceae bacterium]
MKKNSTSIFQKCVAIGIVALAIVIIFSLCSFTLANKATEEIWQQLGISQQDATEKIRTSFLDGYFYHSGVKNITSLATANKVAIAKDLLAYTKQYVGSKNFQNEYEKVREQSKPAAPSANYRSKEDIRKAEIDDVKKQIAKTEDVIKTGTPEMKKIMQPVLDIHNKNLKDYQDPNSQTINLLYQSEVMKQQQDSLQYQKALKNWQTNYPADYKQLIKQRLQHYIDVAATVDFTAALRAEGNKMKFVNNAYEGKNNEWKMIYRSGKDINEAAISFGHLWLAELSR